MLLRLLEDLAAFGDFPAFWNTCQTMRRQGSFVAQLNDFEPSHVSGGVSFVSLASAEQNSAESFLRLCPLHLCSCARALQHSWTVNFPACPAAHLWLLICRRLCRSQYGWLILLDFTDLCVVYDKFGGGMFARDFHLKISKLMEEGS